MQKNGARILLDALIANGVDTIFGYPGGANMTLYDAIHQQKEIKHILTCHEQAAVHAAQGYSRASGKLGVIFLTSGPGATNGVTGITDAMLDSTPLLIITSQVVSHAIGSDAFQEADIIGITKPITKHNYLVKDVKKVYNTVNEAIHIATTGRKGPVLIDIPKDIHATMLEIHEYNAYKVRDSYKVKSEISEDELKPALELILQAKKPVFYCGGGINAAGEEAAEMLKQLVKYTNFPVTLTLMGLGGYDAKEPEFLQMLGMHGSYEANMAMYEADLLIAVGVRFDDRITGKLQKFSPNSRKIHIDIDPSELNKNVKVDVAIKGDCAIALGQLHSMIQGKKMQDISQWWGQINAWRTKDSFGYNQKPDDDILPQHALDLVYKATKDLNPFFTTDVGQHQMWAAQYCRVRKIRRFVTSAGLGTMGFGFPAAIGVKVAYPQDLVICVTGDGSFMMNLQELGAVKRYKIPVKILMLNNGYLGMVRQWQDTFYEGRHTEVDFTSITPDFVKLCESFDIKASVVEKLSDLEGGINAMLEDANAPYLLVVNTKRDEDVYPMIAPGAGHSEMLFEKSYAK